MAAYLPQLPGILSTALGSRSGALKLAGTAFLAELLIVLLSGWQLHDYEASAAVWAVVIPLGVFTVVVGLPGDSARPLHREAARCRRLRICFYWRAGRLFRVGSG